MRIKSLVIIAVLATAILGFSGIVKASTISDLQAQIAQLLAQIQTLQGQQDTTMPATPWCHTFNNNLKVGDGGMDGGSRSPNAIDNDIIALKQALSKEGLYDLNVDEPGTAGTSIKQTIFNEELASSVVQFQAKYGIKQTGYVGPLTRAKLNALYGCGTTPPTIIPQCIADSDCPSSCTACSLLPGATCNGGCVSYKCINNKCVPPTTTSPITVTSPSANSNVTFPLNVTGVINNTGTNQWQMFEGQAGNAQLYFYSGSAWQTIGASPAIIVDDWTAKKTNFHVTLNFNNDGVGLSGGTKMKIVFTAEDASGLGTANTFTLPVVLNGGTQPSVTITSPKSGDLLKIGNQYTITWTGYYNSAPSIAAGFSVYLVTTNSNYIKFLGTVGTGAYSFPWTVTSDITPGNNYQIQLSGYGASGNNSGTFSIVAATQCKNDADCTVAQLLCGNPEGPNYENCMRAGSAGSKCVNGRCVNACTPNWTCNWGQCINGYQSQVPVDSNHCGLYSSNVSMVCPTQTRACAIQQLSVTVTAPNGGEQWLAGSTHNITWNTIVGITQGGSSSTPPYLQGTVTIWFGRMNQLAKLITSTAPDNGTYSWTIPADTEISNDYRILVINNSGWPATGSYSWNNNNFSIVGSTTPQPSIITVTSPNGGESWATGSTHNITWTTGSASSSTPTQISLFVQTSPTTNTQENIAFTTNTGSYTWTIPQKLNVTDLGKGNIYKIIVYVGAVGSANVLDDMSDNYFSIVVPDTQPTITVTSPNGGERLIQGSQTNIIWSSNAPTVMVDLVRPNYECHLTNGDIANAGSMTYNLAAGCINGLSIPVANDYKIRVMYRNNVAIVTQDESDNYFTIAAADSAAKVCASYYRTNSSQTMVQGTWTDSATATASINSCLSYMQQNVLNKPNCGQPDGKYITVALINDSKHTYNMPTIDMSTEFVYSGFCPTGTTTPSITSISPTSGPAGTSVTIIGTGLSLTNESVYIVNTATNSIVSVPVTSPTGTQITFVIPSTLGVGTYNLSVGSVMAGAGPSNSKTFTVVAPACTPNWTCGWGACNNGYQSQIPVDSNHCGLSSSNVSMICPSLVQACNP